MAVYSVHLPGARAASVGDAAFVREGFCWAAFFFGPFWLAARGLWLWTALWCAGFLALLIMSSAGVISSGAMLTLMFLAQLLLGLEANGLLERRLWRRDYNLVEVIAAPHLEEAEFAFYRQFDANEAAATLPAPPVRPASPPKGPTVIGSFPAPEA